MSEFETTLRHAFEDVVSDLEVPWSLEALVLRRARRRRAATVGAAGLIVIAIVAFVASGGFGRTLLHEDARPVSPGEGSVIPSVATAVEEEPCAYGDVVEANDPALPPGASCAWRATGDFDGDDRTDEIYSYGIGGDPAAADKRWLDSTWWLYVSLADGGGETIEFASHMKLGMPLTPHVAGTADADGDGRSEVFLATEVGNGALLSIYAFGEEGLERIEHGGRVFEFSVAGGVNFRSGLTCRDATGSPIPELVLVEAQTPDNETLDVTTTIYRWDSDAEVVEVDSTQDSVDYEDAVPDTALLACGGLEWRP